METFITITLLSAIGVGHLYFHWRAAGLIASLPEDEQRRIESVVYRRSYPSAI